MREKIENKLHIDVTGAPDLTKANHLVLWVCQGRTMLEYKPEAETENTLLLTMPFCDCLLLNSAQLCRIQLAGVDEYGNKFASDPTDTPVGVLLKREGYDGENQT